MKAAIRQRARELGFDDCRFSSAAPPASAGQFQDWLAQKSHGEMGWLERNAEKRLAPLKVLAGAKTIVVLAASYAQAVESRGSKVESQKPAQNVSTLNPQPAWSPATPALTITITCSAKNLSCWQNF